MVALMEEHVEAGEGKLFVGAAEKIEKRENKTRPMLKNIERRK
jgi:hypothetical protein